MKDAYVKDQRVLAYINFNNILLVKDRDQDIRRGYLIHWEQAETETTQYIEDRPLQTVSILS